MCNLGMTHKVFWKQLNSSHQPLLRCTMREHFAMFQVLQKYQVVSYTPNHKVTDFKSMIIHWDYLMLPVCVFPVGKCLSPASWPLDFTHMDAPQAPKIKELSVSTTFPHLLLLSHCLSCSRTATAPQTMNRNLQGLNPLSAIGLQMVWGITRSRDWTQDEDTWRH